MIPFVVPLGSIDNIDACTYLSENWALLAWVGCMGAADASLQLHLSGPVPTTVEHLCHQEPRHQGRQHSPAVNI